MNAFGKLFIFFFTGALILPGCSKPENPFRMNIRSNRFRLQQLN